MQINGIALASVVAEIIGMIIGFIYVWKELQKFQGKWIYKEIVRLNAYKRFIQININLFLRTISLIFTFAFITAQGARFGGFILGANALLMNLQNLLAYVLDGFAHDHSSWYSLQPREKCMRFDELVKVTPSEEALYKSFPGNLYIKYLSNKPSNEHVVAHYPQLHNLFEADNKLLNSYMKGKFNMKFDFISAGCHFLVNHNGVGEQVMHSDFDGNNYEVKDKKDK